MKVEVRIETVLEFLDQQAGGELYPKLGENDTITKVNVNPVTVEFIIAKPLTARQEGEGDDYLASQGC